MCVCVCEHDQEKQTKDALTRKQQKGKKKGAEEESQEAPELLKRPREYTVKFTFPNPPPLSPPILGLHSKASGSLRPAGAAGASHRALLAILPLERRSPEPWSSCVCV